MRNEAKKRKKSTLVLKQLNGANWLKDQVYRIAAGGKLALDSLLQEVGRTLIEGILYMEREELSGPDYHPSSPELKKWASQAGFVYLEYQKIRVERPRHRNGQGEIKLSSYEQVKEPDAFSEEHLMKALCGLSGRRYHETVADTTSSFGLKSKIFHRPHPRWSPRWRSLPMIWKWPRAVSPMARALAQNLQNSANINTTDSRH